MTNSLNKMAGKNSTARNGTPGRPRGTSKMRPGLLKIPNAAYINSIVTPPRKQLRSSEPYQQYQYDGNVKVHISVMSSAPSSPTGLVQRTSPGLVAGYFAGGKWSDPPSPATLPKPPLHWTQLIFANKCSSSYVNGMPQQTDIASQLKVLLNVQA